MHRILIVLVVLALIAAGGLWWLAEPRPALPRADWAAYEEGGDAARGRLVFFAGGCASCHATPKQSDPLKLGGGLELKSPFGTFYPPNISPHPTDGIGTWKVVDLANALLSGVSPQDTHYYPAFPYTSFHQMRLDDVRDLMAFLRTLPPQAGKAPPHALAFPFNLRQGIGLWKLLFLRAGTIEPDPAKSAEWNRGRYLVEVLGHCAECHSPRNPFGAIIDDERFAGGPALDGRGNVPDITPDKTGIGAWSKKDIVEVLTTGFKPDYDTVGGAMVDVVKNTAQLPQSDREAMADYLKSLPPRPSVVRRGK
jgi:mono/diheme cytochrome c family protein